jgi:hypothetical protein
MRLSGFTQRQTINIDDASLLKGTHLQGMLAFFNFAE